MQSRAPSPAATPRMPPEMTRRPHSETVARTRPRAAARSTPGENCTDLGNARRLVARHGGDLRYVAALGWLVWDGRRWRVDDTGEAERRAKETVRSIYGEAAAAPDEDHRRQLAGHALRSERSGA